MLPIKKFLKLDNELRDALTILKFITEELVAKHRNIETCQASLLLEQIDRIWDVSRREVALFQSGKVKNS